MMVLPETGAEMVAAATTQLCAWQVLPAEQSLVVLHMAQTCALGKHTGLGLAQSLEVAQLTTEKGTLLEAADVTASTPEPVVLATVATWVA